MKYTIDTERETVTWPITEHNMGHARLAEIKTEWVVTEMDDNGNPKYVEHQTILPDETVAIARKEWLEERRPNTTFGIFRRIAILTGWEPPE